MLPVLKLSLKKSCSKVTNSYVNHKKNVNLPKLTLPIFSGEIMDFNNFWSMYTWSIDSDTDLSGVAKFTYLCSLLRGDALLSIKGLSITSANYDVAKNTLCTRFGDNKKIIQTHFKALQNLKVPLDTYIELREYIDTIAMHINSLDSLQVSIEEHGVYLSNLTLEKLPSNFKFSIMKELKENYGVFNIIDAINKDVKIKEYCDVKEDELFNCFFDQ